MSYTWRSCCALLLLLVAASACVSQPPLPPLHNDITKGSIEALRKDIDRGSSLADRDDNGLTPLHLALRLQRRAMAIELIQRGADINARTPGGATPLSMAIDNGYADVIDLLLARNAVVESPSLEPGPLFAAIHADNLEVFERLVARGARPNRLNSDGVSLLYDASSSGKVPFVARLLDLGADINFALPDGRTSLHAAVGNSHDAVADLLYSRGAAVTVADGEVGAYCTALVYRFVAQKEYEKRDVARSSQYLQLARSSFLSAQSIVDARAHSFAHKVVKTRVLNVVALALGQAQANMQAQTSISGVGTSIVPLGSTSSDVALRDSYRNVAAFCAREAERMSTIQTCVGTEAGASHACFSSPPK